MCATATLSASPVTGEAIWAGNGPVPPTHQIIQRLAGRMSPKVEAAFLDAVNRLQAGINVPALQAALASGNLSAIEAAAGSGRIQAVLLGDPRLLNSLQQSTTLAGRAGADVLKAQGFEAAFNAAHPNVTLFAREQVGQLVVQVGDDVKEAIRIVVALGNEIGLNTAQQARAIREMVGLPPNWAAAPTNLGTELRAGRFTPSRRLSATDKAQIRSRLARGTVTEPFIQEMQGKYARSLIHRRAINIARTETLRAAHHGQHQSWKQAADAGSIPKDVRRHWVVTPDERLVHHMVPGMNPNGRGLDEMFDTPEGPVLNPPSRTNCRCGEALTFPGRRGRI